MRLCVFFFLLFLYMLLDHQVYNCRCNLGIFHKLPYFLCSCHCLIVSRAICEPTIELNSECFFGGFSNGFAFQESFLCVSGEDKTFDAFSSQGKDKDTPTVHKTAIDRCRKTRELENRGNREKQKYKKYMI